MAVYLYNIGVKYRGIRLLNRLKIIILYLVLSRIWKDLAKVEEVSDLEEIITGKIPSYSKVLF